MADEIDKSEISGGETPEERKTALSDTPPATGGRTQPLARESAGAEGAAQTENAVERETGSATVEAGAEGVRQQMPDAETHNEALPPETGRPNLPTQEIDRPGLELLYDVELDATLQFGSKEMLLRDVLELGPGDVVELDRHIAEPVDLVVGDRIVARGEVVVASGNFALRVTEVATPQMRLESIRCLF